MTAPLIEAVELTKILCKDLKRSLWYGTLGVARELAGLPRQCASLRPGEFRALDRVSLRLMPGESLGVIGRNGAGKTTLLRVVSGLLAPDGGQVTVRGRVGALIALGAGFNPLLTGRENIYVNAAILGFDRAQTQARFDAIVDFAEVHDFIDAPLQTYSSGMQARLGFAVAAQLEPDILLVDEVLAVGDIAFRTKCYRRIGELMANGTAVILVSHQANALLSVCKSAVLLDRGRAIATGPIEEVLRNYEESLATSSVEPTTAGTRGEAARRELRIEEVTLRGPDGQPTDALHTSLPGSIQIRCRSSRSFEHVGAGVTLRRVGSEGEPLVHLDGSRDGMWLTIPAGRSDVTLRMPSVGLMPGRYRGKVFVAYDSLNYLDIIDTFTFRVTSTHSFGSAEFHQAGYWEVMPHESESAVDQDNGGPSGPK